MMTMETLLETYPFLRSFIAPFPPERQDGAEFCSWGASIFGPRMPLCTNPAKYWVEGDQYCEPHAQALARFSLVATPPIEVVREPGAPTTAWRDALRQEEVDLLPREMQELLDTAADSVPLAPASGTISEAALGAWLGTAVKLGLLTRPERSAALDAIAHAIFTAVDRHPQAAATR